MESTRFQTHYDFPSETLVLEISDIWPHDAGTYTVVAENPKTGEHVETSAPLTVRTDTMSIDNTAFVPQDAFRTLDQGKPKPSDAPEKNEPKTPPKVIVPLQPVSCKEGEPIIFTAKVIGNPQPTVRSNEDSQRYNFSLLLVHLVQEWTTSAGIQSILDALRRADEDRPTADQRCSAR